jgi:acetate kinase
MSRTILVINAGSSSLKFEAFDWQENGAMQRRLKGQMEAIGSHPHLIARDAAGTVLIDQQFSAEEVASVEAAQERIGLWLESHLDGLPIAVGHRVVHGGTTYSKPVLLDDAVIADLERLVPLAPLHQPASLAVIRSIRQRRPNLPQIACFDTAFHRVHDPVVDHFAIPETLYAEGIRRYGFHGLSYEFIAKQLREQKPDLAKGRVIVAHLGSGCSLCAMVDGRSADTTMGFTALDGLPMGTRPGELDAGVLLYLMTVKGMTPAAAEYFLYHDCGLKGLSGISGDVRDLLSATSPQARLALDVFIYRIVKAIGALAAAMGGLDAIVFTAGIGENAAPIRADILRKLSWLGIDLDETANAQQKSEISQPGSRVAVLVMPTDEELMIAEHTAALMSNTSPGQEI